MIESDAGELDTAALLRLLERRICEVFMIPPPNYAASHLSDQFARALGRIAQAAGSQSVTGWTPAGIPGSPAGQAGPAPWQHGGPGQAMPEREPWQNDAEYERMCRHLREAREAARGEGS